MGQKKMVITAFYRPPNKVEPSYLQEVSTAFSQLKEKYKRAAFLIAGDFNLPDINWDNHTVTDNSYPHRVSETFLNIAMDLSLEQVVNFPTRQQNTLDLIFMSHPSFKIRCKPLPPIGTKSDHDVVLLDTAHAPCRKRQPRRKIFLWKKANVQGIKQFLKTYPFFTNIDKQNIEHMWFNFKSAITAAVEKFVPTKMSSTRQTHPWVNTNLRRLIRRKQKAHWRAKRSNKRKDWNRYTYLQREAQKTSRQAEKHYLQNVVCEDIGTNPKRFWSYIKSRKQDNEGVSPLIDKDGFLHSDCQRKSEILNDQFKSVYTKENTTHLPDKGPSPHPTMDNITITTPGIEKLLKKLNPHKAAGPDTIPTFILKTAAEELAPVLTTIFQHSIDTGSLPNDWKNANIVPIYKKGDKNQASNYRPVSLTSISCKILEHVIHSSVMKHFQSNKILCDNQHGFRKQRSCETQLITTLHGIASQLRSGKDQVDVVLLDFSKAFDKVPHERLLHKLNYYGVRHATLSWIRSFLSHRKQQVLLDGVSSSEADVLSGVPQGTVLGPLLFLAFINDMPEVTTSQTRLFADDGQLYREIRTDADAVKLQKDLDELERWETKWQMNFHPEKCQVIHVCTNKRYRRHHTYTLHGQTLEAVDGAKYLGVTLSEDFTWKTHIDKTAAKASQTLGFLRRNLSNCTQSVREHTFNALVVPTLNYAAAAWDPYQAGDINQLNKVQRRGARFVCNNYWERTPGCVSSMIHNLGWQSLQEMRLQHRLVLLFKIQHQLLDIDPGPILQQGDRRTRGRSRLHQSFAKSTAYNSSFYPRTIGQWNQLPITVTDSTSLEGFKTALRQFRTISSSTA